MIKQAIKNAILHSVVFCTTVLIFWIWYAAITNVWTNTSTLEVSSWSTLSADSWNKLLWNFENLNSRLWSQSSHHARYYLNGNQVVNRTVWNRLNFTTKEYGYCLCCFKW